MPHRILILDDQTRDCASLEKYLSGSLGYAVTASNDARNAFDAAMSSDYDLAIINAQLARISGIEAYMRLRSIQPDLQAVFLTGEGELNETDRDFLRFSVPEDRVLERPRTDLAQLTRLIVSILGPPIA
jgi:DNA-binding response OmpR family regulator